VTEIPRPRLYLNNAADRQRFIALEFGRVDDGQPEERWTSVGESFFWYHEPEHGRCVGFAIQQSLWRFDPEEDEVAEIWDGPRFDAPVLGLFDVTAGEIVAAAKPFFRRTPSLNRFYFEEAAGASDEKALDLWRLCLETGDSMAHFALGYTLYDMGQFHDAYRHLRHYTEIAPAHPWNWAWFAKGAAAIGEREEAIRACRRAIELTEAGDVETDAPELLASLTVSFDETQSAE
jgi:tetratricopeptide (TPR) repeat protein